MPDSNSVEVSDNDFQYMKSIRESTSRSTYRKPSFSYKNGTFYMDDEKIPTIRKYIYGVGGIPMQLTTNSVAFFFNMFLLEVPQVRPYNLPIISLLGRVWDAITDPMVGALIGSTNTRWGNFKPFMLGAIPLMCISYFFLFYNWKIKNEFFKVLYYVVMFLFFQTAVTLYYIPYGSMCMVLTSEVLERDELTAYRMTFEIFGLLIGSSLFGGIVTVYRPEVRCVGVKYMRIIEEQDKGYMVATGTCMIFIIAAGLVTVFGSIEKNVYQDSEEFSFSTFKKVLCFKPYVILMCTYSFSAIGMAFLQSNLALYIVYVLKIPSSMPIGIFIMMSCAACLIPLAQVLITKIGKKLTYFTGMASAIPGIIVLVYLPSNPNKILFYSMIVYFSYPVMVAFLLPWSMLPDCIDYFVLLYGIRTESSFFSLFVFFQKFALGISVGLTGVVLGYAKYDDTLCEQPKSVAVALRSLMAFGGIPCFVFGILFIYFYPLTEKKRNEMKVILTKRMPVITTEYFDTK